MTKLHGVAVMCLLHAAVVIAQTSPAAPVSPSNETQSNMHLGPVRILFGGEGVDFTPYVDAVTKVVRDRWYELIPAEARPPQSQKGEVAIEFSILPDGQITAMRFRNSSANIPLDRAAWGAITDSAPFTHLPARYAGPYLALRMYFSYNTVEKLDSTSESKDPSSEGPLIYQGDISENAPRVSPGKFRSAELLTDTQGVDFDPYLQKVLRAVRRNWYQIIPAEARRPESKKGEVTLQFAILPDGNVAAVKLDTSSGELALDRAAWGAITMSTPLAALPEKFRGRFVALRLRFYYNPAKSDLQSDAVNSPGEQKPPSK